MAAARKPTRRKKSKAEEISGTKLELTLAAEKVFAMNGVQGASLRQIREEAGQKNESAIHYYFGSREAIIESILAMRSKPIDADRHAMFEEARRQAAGKPLSTEQIMRCGMMPLARYLFGTQEPGYYLRFLVQLRMERSTWLHFNEMCGAGMEKCLDALKEAKPYLPKAIVEQRFLSMLFMHTNGMATIERIQSEKGESFRREEAWIRIEDIIACSAAMYDAPLSPETLEAIRGASELYDLPSYTDIAMIQKAGTGDDQ